MSERRSRRSPSSNIKRRSKKERRGKEREEKRSLFVALVSFVINISIIGYVYISPTYCRPSCNFATQWTRNNNTARKSGRKDNQKSSTERQAKKQMRRHHFLHARAVDNSTWYCVRTRARRVAGKGANQEKSEGDENPISNRKEESRRYSSRGQGTMVVGVTALIPKLNCPFRAVEIKDDETNKNQHLCSCYPQWCLLVARLYDNQQQADARVGQQKPFY